METKKAKRLKRIKLIIALDYIIQILFISSVSLIIFSFQNRLYKFIVPYFYFNGVLTTRAEYTAIMVSYFVLLMIAVFLAMLISKYIFTELRNETKRILLSTSR